MKEKDKVSDIDLNSWKEYEDIYTDSLWLIGERDKTGAHNNAYHGNFIPQIPSQMIRRYTKQRDVVLDLFLGHGTTLIETKRLGRNGIGVELIPAVARQAERNIGRQSSSYAAVSQKVLVADSSQAIAKDKIIALLQEMNKKKVSLIILHPPYHDIIKFSDHQKDLCNAPTLQSFVSKFGDVIELFHDLLGRNNYLVIVIGDKYANKEWIPLGFHLMQETLKRSGSLRLKSIVIKNMSGNRAKINQNSLWRYRALAGGFYVFKHEYILLFQKK